MQLANKAYLLEHHNSARAFACRVDVRLERLQDVVDVDVLKIEQYSARSMIPVISFSTYFINILVDEVGANYPLAAEDNWPVNMMSTIGPNKQYIKCG